MAEVYLIGIPNLQINGDKLPSNRQVLSVFFSNMKTLKLTSRKSAILAVEECFIFSHKAQIPTRQLYKCVDKLMELYAKWRNIQKSSLKNTQKCVENRNQFLKVLDNLFDIAHLNALTIMESEEAKTFLVNQRSDERLGSLADIYEKNLKEKIDENISIDMEIDCDQDSIISDEPINFDDDDDNNDVDYEPPQKKISRAECLNENHCEVKRGKINVITPKLAAVLDRCMLSVRDSVYVIEAVADALEFDVKNLIINRTSINKNRIKLREERAEKIKDSFSESIPQNIVIHWDGKKIPALNVRDSAVERLPIVVSTMKIEQLIGVPKLSSSTGEEQASAVYDAINKWGLKDSVQALCCDTTASNTGRLNGACVLLEKKMDKDLLYLPCRHHIYELILRSVFEAKIPQITVSPDIPMFKNFRKDWIKINISDIKIGIDDKKCNVALISDKLDIISFAEFHLSRPNARGDYRELLELAIIFLGENIEGKYKIHPPGAMHQARWMSRAIYCLKIFIFRHQFELSKKDEESIRDICIFIIKFYLKAWFECPLPTKAPVQDLNLINNLKAYEKTDNIIAKAALNKISNHLWYLTEEACAFSFFDDGVNIEIKKLMVKSLSKNPKIDNKKRQSIKDISDTGIF